MTIIFKIENRNLISKEGEPVIVSLLVDPKNKSGIIQDFGIITSAYGKNLNNLQKLINNSNIRYIEPDKKRTNKWLSVLRLQLPSSTTKYGSVNKITYAYQNVNDIAFMDKKGALVVANAKNNPDRTSVNAPLKDSFNESISQNNEKDNDILKQDNSTRTTAFCIHMEDEILTMWICGSCKELMRWKRKVRVLKKYLRKQVDKVLNKQWEGLNALYVTETPEILQQIGLKQLPMLYMKNT